jgi:hypothetical protein
MRHRVGWRGRVLGLERLRAAGDREHDAADEARVGGRWERGKGAGLVAWVTRICVGEEYVGALL